MREKILEIIRKYRSDSVSSSGISFYNFDDIANEIADFIRDTEDENKKLKFQLEMKNALIGTYETIIGNSNFKPILDKTKKSKEK